MLNLISVYSSQYSNIQYIKNITNKEISTKIDPNPQLAKRKFNVNFSLQTLYNYINKNIFEFMGYKKDNNKIIYKSKKEKVHNKRVEKSGEASIKERPLEINKREEFGHWEIDSVIATRESTNKSILTLTERVSKLNIVRIINSKTNENVIKKLKKIIKSKKYLIKSITSDNGTEFANVKEITKLGVIWYFAHPYYSNKRGSNEANNKFVRRFLPKGVSMDKITKKEVKEIQNFMNNYPRKIFNSSTSQNIYDSALNLI